MFRQTRRAESGNADNMVLQRTTYGLGSATSRLLIQGASIYPSPDARHSRKGRHFVALLGSGDLLSVHTEIGVIWERP